MSARRRPAGTAVDRQPARAWSIGGRLGLLGIALGLSLSGCFLFGPPVRSPSVAGVIQSAENVNGAWVYQLEGGEIVEIDFDETETLPESTGGGAGAPLLYGDEGEAWYFTVREPHTTDRGHRFNAAARDAEEHIVFENGVRLPKAPEFDGHGWPQDGRYDSPTQSSFAPFCINGLGQVTAYLAQPSDQREGSYRQILWMGVTQAAYPLARSASFGTSFLSSN